LSDSGAKETRTSIERITEEDVERWKPALEREAAFA